MSDAAAVDEVLPSAFGRELAERHRPGSRLAAGIVRRSRPGDLAMGVGRFGTRLGLSQTSRWALEGRSNGRPGGRNVRPPIDYWPWPDQDDAQVPSAQVQRATKATPAPTPQPAAPQVESTGDAKLDRLRQLLAGPAPEPTAAPVAPVQRAVDPPLTNARWDGPAPRVHRGLPRTLTRRGGTTVGSIERDGGSPVAMPGAVVRRAQPEVIDPSRVPPRDAVQRAPRAREGAAAAPVRARQSGAAPANRSASSTSSASSPSSSSPRRAADRDGAPGPASAPLRVADAPVADLIARRTAAVEAAPAVAPTADRSDVQPPPSSSRPSASPAAGTQAASPTDAVVRRTAAVAPPAPPTPEAFEPAPTPTVTNRSSASSPAPAARSSEPAPTPTVAQRSNASSPAAQAFEPAATPTVANRSNASAPAAGDSVVQRSNVAATATVAPPTAGAIEPAAAAALSSRPSDDVAPADRVVRRKRASAPSVPSGPAWRSAPRPARSMSAVLPSPSTDSLTAAADAPAPTPARAEAAPSVRPLALVVDSPTTAEAPHTAAAADPIVRRATATPAGVATAAANVEAATARTRSAEVAGSPSPAVDTPALTVKPALSPAPPSLDDPATAAEHRGSPSPAVVRRAADAEVVARRFAEHVDAAPTPAPRTLAPRWQPLARAIVGDRPVSVRTDAVARRALADAGKIAATAGNVIHLQRDPSSAADAAVLAHELTHVAHPSPTVRFFDDDRPSAEERRAEQVAEMIRRSPVLPHPGGGNPAIAGGWTSSLAAAAPMAHALMHRGADADAGAGAPSPSSSSTSQHSTASSASAASGSSASSASTSVVRRTPVGRTPNAPAPAAATPSFGAGDTISAAALAARFEGGRDTASSTASSLRDEAVVRRRIAASNQRVSTARPSSPSSSSAAASSNIKHAGGDDGTVRRLIGGHRIAAVNKPVVEPVSDVAAPSNASAPAPTAQSPDAGEEQWDLLRHTVDSSGVTDLLEWIVDRIEERIGDDLARRGGRHRGAF